MSREPIHNAIRITPGVDAERFEIRLTDRPQATLMDRVVDLILRPRKLSLSIAALFVRARQPKGEAKRRLLGTFKRHNKGGSV